MARSNKRTTDLSQASPDQGLPIDDELDDILEINGLDIVVNYVQQSGE